MAIADQALRTEGAVDGGALPAPAELRARIPLPAAAARVVGAGRRAVRDVLHGRDPRLVMVVGPCSLHDPGSALDYAARLAALAETLRQELVVVMRTYVEKPRTALGWKGLVADPHLDGSCDVAAGLELARRLLIDIHALGVPCGSELLDPLTPAYLADLLSWGSLGARTSESQPHRQLASGLPLPIGIKNGTSGALEPARDGMIAVAHPHRFPSIGDDGRAAVRATPGNPDRHLVLRGGRSGPNHDRIRDALALVADLGVARPVMVDCSHDNSGRDPAAQAGICRCVLQQVRDGVPGVLGLLVESHLVAGRQDFSPDAPLRYGVSITDPCLGWDETADLLCEAAEAVKLARDR